MAYPYGLPDQKPDMPLSEAMRRLYEDYEVVSPDRQELYSNFKYTRLEGLDYQGHDGSVSRRDPSKVIRVNDRYYVWYTRRQTPTPPRGPEGATETIPSTDWDLAEIWYATSEDGFTWTEQGLAISRPPRPDVGWRSVCTPDILVWKGRYYLYYQGFVEMSGVRGDFCPVTASEADSPDGPWRPAGRIVVDNGPAGTWDQFAIHDPYPLIYKGRIHLYYKAEMADRPNNLRAQGLAIADHPFGPFEKHPLNPVTNSGHETCLFPFREGIAAMAIRHGHEHDTIQYAPDGVNFKVVAVSNLLPIAAGPHVPDAFTDSGDGRGITWGLSHFTNAGGPDTKHSILARFDCSLSRDFVDLAMKQTELFLKPEVFFSQGLSPAQRARIAERNRKVR